MTLDVKVMVDYKSPFSEAHNFSDVYKFIIDTGTEREMSGALLLPRPCEGANSAVSGAVLVAADLFTRKVDNGTTTEPCGK